jgi:pimeloyl-ACP methyl ester carboxylesterase
VRSATGLHVTVWGAGEPAVLVHGSFGWGSETWREQKPLADAYQLLLVDRRGFGESPADGRADFESDADDVAEVLADGAHLVGHSYGGVVALLAAARRPESVRSLAVIEPPALGLVRGDPPAEELIRAISEGVKQAEDPADYRVRFLRSFGFPASREELEGPALMAARSSWRERHPYEADIPLDELERASFPKLVVRGTWDNAPLPARERAGAVFGSICDVLEERLRAESVRFEGAAHNPQLLGEPFNARLRTFWEAA